MASERSESTSSRIRRRRAQMGSSLVETLAALALFAMSTATVGDFLVGQIRTAGSNHSHVAAYELGIEELENLRSLPYEDVASRASSTKKGGMVYSVTTNVDEDIPGPAMKSITVDVAWNEPGGTRHVLLETIEAAVIH